MKKTKVVCVVVGLMVGLNAHAAIIKYDGGPLGDQVDLSVATNWVGDVAPTSSDIGVVENFDSSGATVRSPNVIGGLHYQFTGTTFWDVGGVNSRTKSAHIEMLDSAVFKMGKDCLVESGGTLSINSTLATHTALDSERAINFKESGGTVNHLNGVVDARQGLRMNVGSGNVYNLSGGQLVLIDSSVSTTYFDFAGDNYLNFTSGSTGTIVWNRDEDFSATFADRIANGYIRIDGAVADISDFDITYTEGVGTTMAIPEPATLGLIGLASCSLLALRRIIAL